MPNPDMITQYLASRGAAPSAENASRARAHFGANPDLLDRRAMGLPGGLDDNSAVLDAYLDKHIADSMPTPAGTVTVGEVEQVPPPSPTGPRVKGPGEVGGTKQVAASRQGSYGPGPSPSRQGEYGTPAGGTASDIAQGAQAGAGIGDVGKWLMALLGAGSVAGRAAMTPNPAAAAPNTAMPDALPGSVAPDMSNTPPAAAAAAPVDTTDPAVMRQRMQAEIDAENDAMYRQMEQEASKQRSQRNTEDLAKAARRATGRR